MFVCITFNRLLIIINHYVFQSLLCASRDVPVHLWDAYTGKITASYVTNNYVHELLSGRSVCFSRDGLHIIVGYEKFISIFDVARPGATGQLVGKYNR